MNTEKKNSKSLLQRFIDLLSKIFFIKQKTEKEKKNKTDTDDIYPLW
jgi:hypothetical protein